MPVKLSVISYLLDQECLAFSNLLPLVQCPLRESGVGHRKEKGAFFPLPVAV